MHSVLRSGWTRTGTGVHQGMSHRMPALWHEGRHAAARQQTGDATAATYRPERCGSVRSADDRWNLGGLHLARRNQSREIRWIAEESAHPACIHDLEKLV